jgi:hypothetical protein
MPKLMLNHEINCDADTFWKLFFNQDFNVAMYKQGLGFTEFQVLEQRDGDRETFRKVHASPKVEMPGPLAKMFGGGLKYTEEGTFDKGSKIWRWKMTPSSMADKIKNEGTMRLEPAGAGKVRRIAEILIEAKIFGLGGMIEGMADKSLKEGWENSAKFMNKWIADGKAT